MHPVYVLEQSNEAYYFKLDESTRPGMASPTGVGVCGCGAARRNFPDNFAAAMLASAEVMSGYLEEHDRKSNPTIYKMTYALLHSYSHYIMQGIQQFSGLDLGSIGEYMFPCDLGVRRLSQWNDARSRRSLRALAKSSRSVLVLPTKLSDVLRLQSGKSLHD